MSHVVFIDRASVPTPSPKNPKKGLAVTGVIPPYVLPTISPESMGVAVRQLDLSWYYNYGPTPGSRAKYRIPITDPGPVVLTPGVPFVPMVLDASHDNPTELAFLDPYARSAGAVLGPNEPYIAGEADMTVAQAVALYGRLNAQFPPGSGVLIGSPAGEGTTGAALTWFHDFFTQLAANGYRCDFFCFHWSRGYDPISPITPAAAFASYAALLSDAITQYGLPIWATENEVYSATLDNVPPLDFMTQLWNQWVPFNNSLSQVQRWAWWTLCPNPFTGNVCSFNYSDFDGKLTPLGNAYSLLE